MSSLIGNSDEKLSIHEVCTLGDHEALEVLLSKLEDNTNSNPYSALTSVNDEGMVPLHISLLNAHSKCVELLLKAGADPMIPYEGLPSIHLALSLGGFEVFRNSCTLSLKALLEFSKVQIDARDRFGQSVLHRAAACGMTEAISLLTQAGADANIKDFAGRLAIHSAIEHRQADCVRTLLNECGSDLLLPTDGRGDTPIHLAVRRGGWECVAILINLGTEVLLNIPNEQGLTAEEVAEICGFSEEFRMIKNQEIPPDHGKRQTLVVTHELCLEHGALPIAYREVPELVSKQKRIQNENPFRLEVLSANPQGALLVDEFADNLLWMNNPLPATVSDILRVHEYSYFRSIQSKCEELREDLGPVLYDRDTTITDKSFTAAIAAAGSVIAAIEHVLKGTCKNAFCAVRPPGHHAGPRGAVEFDEEPGLTSNGFCIFNNIAIGAAYCRCILRESITRVAIVDFDVHHGNGTDAIVRNLTPNQIKTNIETSFATGKLSSWSYKPWLDEEDIKNVLFISTHAYGEDLGGRFYPASGAYEESAEQYPGGILNLPLEHGTNSASFRKGKSYIVYRDKVFPRLLKFNPDIILVSAGFDAHELDKINHGYVELDEEDYVWVTEELVKIANSCCDGRLGKRYVVSVLEGGYKIKGGIISAFAQSVVGHVRALLNATKECYSVTDPSSVEKDQRRMELKRSQEVNYNKMALRKRPAMDPEMLAKLEEELEDSGISELGD
jgi:acetoin utilization deacetylase AcuC-like enzyme/ankyrin repeat protein